MVLVDTGVSNVHARLLFREGRWWIEDLATPNGTLVNGAAARGPTALRTGDTVALGQALLAFAEVPDAESGRARVVPQGVAVAGRADTGEVPLVASAVPAPRQADPGEVITAPGDQHVDDVKDDSEVTAPEGVPLRAPKGFGEEDRTAPVGKPLARADGPASAAAAPGPQAGESTTGPSGEHPSGPEAERSQDETALDVKVEAPPLAEPTDSTASPLFEPLPRRLEGPTVIGAGQERRAPPAPAESETRPQAPPALTASALGPVPEVTPVALDSGLTRPVLPSVRAPAAESAADRARRRRALGDSLWGQARFWWSELPFRTRAAAVFTAGVVASVGLVGLVQFLRPAPPVELPAEPQVVSATAELPWSFGYGAGVDYEHRDEKTFTFPLSAPTEAAVVVHLRARDLGRNEVVVAINGAEVEFLPEDIGVPDRELEVLLPQKVLNRDAQNTLAFVNVKNPQAKDTWRISHLRLELVPVPALSAQEALLEARGYAQRASRLVEARAAGSANIYDAWKAYRQAWITLLAVPEAQRGEFYAEARIRAAALQKELDQQCGALLLSAKKAMELKNPEKAKEILEQVEAYFPGNEHRCQNLAREKLYEYEL